MQEKRVFFTRLHPRRHAQEAIFPVIYSVFFLHLSNTDFDPQKSANHPPQRAVFTVILQCFFHISNTQITLPPPHGSLCWTFLGPMLGFVGSSWAYVVPAWDYVGRSWVLCWAILALCWPILGHVARCSNLTPCNSPQRAVFTVIYSVFCTFPTPILTPKSLQITLPPPPHACRRKRLSVSNAFRHQVLVRLSLYQLQHSQRAACQSPLAARAAAAVRGSWRPGPWRRLRRSPRYPRCWDRGSQRQSRQSNDLVPLRCQVLMFPEVGVFGNLMINSSILK